MTRRPDLEFPRGPLMGGRRRPTPVYLRSWFLLVAFVLVVELSYWTIEAITWTWDAASAVLLLLGVAVGAAAVWLIRS